MAVVYGTRPEIVKLGGVVRRLGPYALLVHTGQHFDATMSEDVAVHVGMPVPDIRLDVGGLPRAGQISAALGGLDKILARRELRAVVVQGDTNATVAGALAANARGLPLMHVEAGLRSLDRTMPEEHNRVVTDHLSDLLCAPTPGCVANLAREGIIGDHVALTGNTVVEAVRDMTPPPAERAALLARLGLTACGYVLATIHRPENTDDACVLATILSQLAALPLEVVLPLHPRTAAAVRRHGLEALLRDVRVLDSLGPRTFLGLAAETAVLVSDSGGVQEECTVLGRPLVVVRRSTERPEVMADFARLSPGGVGLASAVGEILGQCPDLLDHLASLASPFGDGTASGRIAAALGELAGVPRDRMLTPAT
ncbi:UDP-N-acetylglucosamine 2-epimerase (non-hydrolyzing) [Actinomadura sp. DC4]|uniref:non-hydrolyzing UDP-N-acetylglucosamine 2-epimerase n=1 Tax=Actinomadura sp. DC4 TaxID=3055069 RepID=UPI0025B0998D|nr:UDP-N-acetylglucosamine 2-epimerase (non-hydrolyzing) [Actinomadura sp. DC4]MDN3351963.1 UDP-N-acetylglucosamine 2-epimerase (non-hydrolyzing) [Actinomadura sp. DC4]